VTTSSATYLPSSALAQGAHTVTAQVSDLAGNRATASSAFIVASVLPAAGLDYPWPQARGVEQAVGGVVDVRGGVSSPALRSWSLSVAAGSAAASGFSTLATGAGNVSGHLASWDTRALSGYFTLKLVVLDSFGRSMTSTAPAFVGRPVMDFAIGKRNSNAKVAAIADPEGIVVRQDGWIWVAADDTERLILVSSRGVVAATITGDAAGRFKHPRGLSLDGANNLYVADRDDNVVAKFSPDGSRVLYEFRTGLKSPDDAVVDSDGSVYVADTGNSRVRVFTAAGAVLRDIPVTLSRGRSQPWGVALSSAGSGSRTTTKRWFSFTLAREPCSRRSPAWDGSAAPRWTGPRRST